MVKTLRRLIYVGLLCALFAPIILPNLIGLAISLGLCLLGGLAFIVIWLSERSQRKKDALRGRFSSFS